MIIFTVLVLAVIFFGCSKSKDNNPTPSSNPTYKATLNGQQETPQNQSAATGSVNFTLNSGNMLTGTVTWKGLKPTAAHIHHGAAGVAGPVVFPINITTDSTGSVNFTSIALSSAQRASLDSGNYYVNIHSAAFPNGEIRGQLLKSTSSGSGNGNGYGNGGGGSNYP